MRILAGLLIVIAMASPAVAGGEPPIHFLLGQGAKVAPIFSVAKKATKYNRKYNSPGRDVSIVDEAARRLGVPVSIARAVLRVESGGDCRARSPAGALGAMQVLPATARAMGVYGDLRRCENSIEAGMRYLRRIIAANGVSCASLSLYNRGEAAYPICTSYGRQVLAYAGKV